MTPKSLTFWGHIINITGGEPFIREDVFDIINYIGGRKLPFGILTNGSFLADREITCLKRNKVSIVQLSIDGNCDTHDDLRAVGDYKRTFEIAVKLETEGIKTLISFTANKKITKNYHLLRMSVENAKYQSYGQID